MKKLLILTFIGILTIGCTNQKQQEFSKKIVAASQSELPKFGPQNQLVADKQTMDESTQIDKQNVSTPIPEPVTTSSLKETADSQISDDVEAEKTQEPSMNTVPVEKQSDRTYTKDTTHEESLDFTIEKIEDPNLPKGVTKIEQEGFKGLSVITLRHTYTNDKLVKTEVLSEAIKQEPVKQIIKVGTQEPTYSVTENKAMAREAFDLINKIRNEAGVHALIWNDAFYDFALIRAQEIVQSFSHNRLDGSAFYEGSNLLLNGENIAAGQPTAKDLVDAWYNSQGHKENMLRSGFNYGAIAVINTNEGYRTYSVNLFGQ